MKRTIGILIALFLFLAVMGEALARTNKDKSESNKITDLDKRKAEYIFLQSQAFKEKDSVAAYYDLIKHAYFLDSTNTAISFYYGYMLTLKNNSSEQDRHRGLELMKRHVDAHPEDYYEASYYSDACMSMREKEMALTAIEKLAELNPNKTEVLTRLALAYVSNEKYAEALKTYEKIEEFEGRSIETSALKVSLCQRLCDTVGAIQQIHKLYDEAPSNVDYNLVTANCLRK